MLIFWVLAGLLLAGGLFLILPSLIRPRATVQGQVGGANVAVYRDQLKEAERDLAADLITPERFEQLKAEIQRRVLEDTQGAAAPAATAAPSRKLALALALVIPLASVGTYLTLGAPDAVSPTVAAPANGDQHQVTPDQIQRMVAALAERLKADPGNADGWLMLGRSYAALDRYGDAVGAYRKAVDLMPGNANVLADLADVMAMSQGKQLAGEPMKIIQQALAIDPRHVKALALAGSAAFEAKDYAGARTYWERLVVVVGPDSEMANAVRGGIAEATQLEAAASGKPGPAAAAASAPQPAAAAAASVTGEVVLAPELAARVAAGDTVYVFARAAQGPRMPLATLRQPVGSWPLRFTLDDSSAMTPELRLSGQQQVVVGARISRSGNATPSSGDLTGQSAPVAVGAQGVRVVIDRVQE